MIHIWVQQVTGTKRKLEVPEDAAIPGLRRRVARELQLPEARLKLVHKGTTLQDWTATPGIADGDTLLAFVAPTMPTAQFSQRVAAGGADDEEANERFRLPANAPRWKRSLADFLRRRLRFPDVVLQLVFAVKPRVYLSVLLWFLLAPLAARFEVGPIYVLATILAVILCNLGSNGSNEMSAYSIFNEGQRQLPGQLNADAIDQQIRAGNV